MIQMKIKTFLTLTALTVVAMLSVTMIGQRIGPKPKRPMTRMSPSLTCTTTKGFNTNMILTTTEQQYIQPYLTKLKLYQDNCGSQAFSSMMIFTSMPTDPAAIAQESVRISNILTAMSKIGIKPIIIAEPGKLSFIEFNQRSFDKYLSEFFISLKANGVTDQMMGLWVPFPEPNIPVWNSIGSNPTMIAQNFNIYMEALRETFPTVKGSILLNSKSFAPEDVNWESGQYSSLAEYGSSLNPAYLDSVGIQGFPWIGPKGTEWGYDKSAETFLQPELTIELAQAAGVKKVWFNTGSFSSKYTLDPAKTVIIPNIERATTLNSILITSVQVRSALGKDSKVMLHIFAEDKSQVAEATNWSFSNTQELNMLKNFIIQANKFGFETGFFDIAK